MPPVDPPEFRQLLGRFATGVTIVTAVRPDGRPIGMTASSLASVSLQPPLVSLCIDREAEIHEVLRSAPRWAINILAADQEALSRRFAAPNDDRFDGIGYDTTSTGLVLLDGTLAHIECVPEAFHPAGDHTIVVGRVTGGRTHPRLPLLYYRGGYTGFT